MYEILLISADRGFTNLALKFIPHINGSIQVSTATNVKDGVAFLEREASMGSCPFKSSLLFKWPRTTLASVMAASVPPLA